ncbi:hypothetical protein C1645_839945 [Glomus cerebriforme]|uniref:DUF659 domain-containing protein n=1 Tax=Glomus cerebriforme TaxID=658196 RepID=A0A397S2Q8_9GLOM|nr:hypothetical protein C1645_839945 [Glomus cerebriforme]
MKEVIEKVGPERISTIVSDNAANIKKAKEIITKEYPKIKIFDMYYIIQVIEAFYHIYCLESFHRPTDVPVFALREQAN